MTKIEALQKTIYNLENDVYEYKWINSESCNCGILSRTILNGKTAYKAGLLIAPSLEPKLGAWGTRATCMKTGISMPEVFKSLSDCGFTFEEIVQLEDLSNSEINEKLGWELFDDGEGFYWNSRRSDKESVILYLKEWVKMLQEKEPKTVFVTYSKIIEQIPVNAN